MKESNFERPQAETEVFEAAVEDVRSHMHYLLKQYGNGLCVSSHEISGLLHEEMEEFSSEVHGNNLDGIREELIDVAITAIWGLASMKRLDIIKAGWGKEKHGRDNTTQE